MNILFSGKALRKLGTVLAGGAALMLTSSFATADVTNSKHNLSATGTLSNSFAGTGEICIFCHTPHGANVGVVAPLWNRNATSADAPAVYTRYSSLGTPSFDATEAAVGSVSLACLSCHDGTQAMNSIINTPGSGTNPAGFTGVWSSPGPDSTVTGTGFLGNNAGSIQAPMLGTDLSNDHPISMQYGGGGITILNATTPGAVGTEVTNDKDFAQPTGNDTTATLSTVGYKIKNGKNIWYVEANGTAGLQKTDLPLYTRSDTTASSVEMPLVECASCHDPHNTTNGTFLRKSNSTTASGLCLTCHIK